MKIVIVINADYNGELYLHSTSDKLKNEILRVIEKYVEKGTIIDYGQEYAQIDTMTGETVNQNPYPIQRQFNSTYDKENEPLYREIKVIIQ